MGIFNQIIGTAIACYLCLVIGLMYSWPSSTVKLFKYTNTTLSRPMTEIEASLLGSLPCVSSFISIPIAGYLNDKLGRKYSCAFFATLQVMSWLIISCCYIVEVVLASVFVGGMSGCLIILVPIYVGEICQESIRGTMTSFTIFFMTTGTLMSYLLGGLLQYQTLNYAFLSFMVFGVIMMNFMKESPTFLMKKGLVREAASTIAYYRGLPVDSEKVHQEVENLRKALSTQFNAAPEEEKLKMEASPRELTFLQFFEKSRSTRRALAVCLFLYTAAVFQGLIVVQVYALPLFEEAVPNMSATAASVLFAIVSMIGCSIAAFLMDRLGRRPLMIYGSLATCLCCVALGTQISVHWGPYWLTPLFLYMYCLTYLCGAGTVPYVIAAEVFLPQVRSYLTVTAMEWGNICSFTILFVFNPFVASFGLGSVFYFFAVICFLSAVVSAACLPETKGLAVDVIQTKFEMQW